MQFLESESFVHQIVAFCSNIWMQKYGKEIRLIVVGPLKEIKKKTDPWWSNLCLSFEQLTRLKGQKVLALFMQDLYTCTLKLTASLFVLCRPTFNISRLDWCSTQFQILRNPYIYISHTLALKTLRHVYKHNTHHTVYSMYRCT